MRWPEGKQRPEARDYTPRRYDSAAGELDIDFVVHGDGPASSWASQAQPGDKLAIGGPRGSRLVPDDFDYYVLLGDETTLPAIGRHLEELPASSRVIVLLEVADAAEEQSLANRDSVEVRWLHRDGAEPGSTELLLSALRELKLPDGDGYFFAAGEAGTLRPIRRYLADELGANKDWTSISGYWKRGTANHDHHEPI
ncbi:siderophore-interacting protein [Fodinicola feengrottensis]|uniref:siderophore-interacting protein n=1 Tax=Fodinicola feengrottensis TaxID=435914 RepID=UPI0024424710|nr:siderophore-interacting protein [Fodinicola feengrottensis]